MEVRNEQSSTGNSHPMPRTSSLSVASLRRSLNSPIRIAEAEHQHQTSSREGTPLRTVDDLASRPRSNPRSRTPMRYESPLNAAEFRRDSFGSEADDTPRMSPHDRHAMASRRITIRPLAGTAVGTIVSTRILEERPSTPKSRKQGPSHRKVRRWNNEHFGRLANEIAASSSRAAEALSKGQRDAHLYRDVYDPADSKSKTLERFMHDSTLTDLRDRFFAGELPAGQQRQFVHRKYGNRHSSDAICSSEEMLHRVDPRLRRVVVKACQNSGPAAAVVRRLERFIVKSFRTDPRRVNKNTDDWSDLLLEIPTVSERKDNGNMIAQFYFDPDSSTGGFHRLLLHAVCQFHGLTALSRMVDISINGHSKARGLQVEGRIVENYQHRLLTAISDEQES